jgi:Na+/melibiose symporter-like transporter
VLVNPFLAAYLAALLLAGALLLPRFPVPAVGGARSPVTSMARQWLDGLAAVRSSRTLRVTGLTLVLSAFAQGMFLVLFVLFVLETLDGGESGVGLLRGVQAIGGLSAGIAVATVLRRAPPVALLGWGTVVLGLISAVIWHLPQVTLVFGAYVGLFAVARPVSRRQPGSSRCCRPPRDPGWPGACSAPVSP